MTSRPAAPPPALTSDQAWVSPADIVAKRLVSLPPPVAEGLLRVSAEVAQDAMSASAAAQIQCQSGPSDIAADASITEQRFLGAPVVAPPRESAFDRSH